MASILWNGAEAWIGEELGRKAPLWGRSEELSFPPPPGGAAHLSVAKMGQNRAKQKAVFPTPRQRQLPDTPPYSASDPGSPPQVKGESAPPSTLRG